MTDAGQKRGFVGGAWYRFKVWSRRIAFLVGTVFVLYLLVALAGLIPVNNDFEQSPGGIEVAIFSGQFHSDLILPLNNPHNWMPWFPESDFEGDISEATHVAIGWGERDFYLHTPTWADLKLSTASKALLMPTDTVMHVEMTIRPQTGKDIKRVMINATQYAELVKFVSASFRKDSAGNFQRIEGESYGRVDAFYEANGSYHAFRTCNCWAGEAMKAAGIRVGWFTPFPKTVFLHLGDEPTE